METIAELVQMHPEEGQGGFDAALANETRIVFEAQLEFAGLQLRARTLAETAWAAYTREAELMKVLDDLLDAHAEAFNAEARAAINREVQGRIATRSHAFRLWSDLNTLAWAEGREALALDAVSAGISAIVWMEQKKADELLKAQTISARYRAEREAAEKAEAAEPTSPALVPVAAGVADDDDPFRDK